jgi:hypothetical protein
MAWEFDITAIIPEEGAWEVDVRLDSIFEGREYVRNAPIATSMAVIVEEPVLLLGVAPWIVAVAGSLLVLLAGFAIWFQRKTSPFGFILDDGGRLVVDFSKLDRSFVRRMFARNVVHASELVDLPFDGGSFKFKGDKVKLIYKRALGDPSMRVDSRPVGPEVELDENVWLGVGGRLLSFQLESQVVENEEAEVASEEKSESSRELDDTVISNIASAPAGD